MVKSIESVGKNVEQAIENGLKELNTTRDKVTIEVIETGGFFKKAKVLITIDDVEEKEREENIARLQALEDSGALNSDFSSLLKEKEEDNGTIDDSQNQDDKEDEVVEDVKEDKTEETTAENGENIGNIEFEEVKNDESETTVNEQDVNLSQGALKAKEFTETLLQKFGIETVAEINESKDVIQVELVGKEAYKIIGKHGDGLNALQYITNIIASRNDKDCGKVYIDTCGYKDEREQELIKLARKLKYSAVKEEKAIKLEPMSAYDRKIIHKALAEDDLVETHSEGEEPRRYIVIEPKKETAV